MHVLKQWRFSQESPHQSHVSSYVYRQELSLSIISLPPHSFERQGSRGATLQGHFHQPGSSKCHDIGYRDIFVFSFGDTHSSLICIFFLGPILAEASFDPPARVVQGRILPVNKVRPGTFIPV